MDTLFFEKIFLDKDILKSIELCRKYIVENDLSKASNGSYIINSDVFVNIFEYNTDEEENRIFEAHRQYIDLHYVISGEEMVASSYISEMDVGEYHEDNDYLEVNGKANTKSKLKQGDLILWLPFEAHKTGIVLEKQVKVKKAVFKIKIH